MADNILDRTIGYFLPKTALERSQARIQLQTTQRIQKRGYEAAAAGRLSGANHRSWMGSRASADAEDFFDLPVLRERSRDLCRNNPHALKATDELVRNTIGDGIYPRPKTGDADKDRDIALAFKAWASHAGCDSDGLNDFNGLQQLAARMMFESGEVLIRRIIDNDSGNPIPLKLQLLEADYLDDTRNGPLESGSMTIRGVEISNTAPLMGKRVAYWLFANHPGAFPFNTSTPLLSQPVPASEILHVYERSRPVARGKPWGTPAFEGLRNLADYEYAEIQRKKLEACSVAFITTPDDTQIGYNPIDPLEVEGDLRIPPGTFDQYGTPIDRFEPGTINYLQQGKEIKFNQPQGVGGYAEYKSSQLRTIAAGFRLPVELMSGDYSDVNFSSSRAVMEGFQKLVRAVQWGIFVAMMLDPIWKWWCEAAFLAGVIDDPNIPVEWSMPLRPLTNPVDDVAAMRDMIRNNLRSPQDVITEFSGKDWQDVVDETSVYFDYCAAKGIVLDNNPGAVSLKGVSQKNDPSGKSKDSLDSRQLRDMADEFTTGEQERLYDILRERFRKKR